MPRKFGINLLPLAVNLLLVYALYAVARGVFWLYNAETYRHVGGSYLAGLFGAGLIFDTSAILYSNALFILLFLLPLHVKERRGFYRLVRWLYAVVNTLMLSASLCDCVYFQFTGRRTTASVMQEFSNEGLNVVGAVAREALRHWPLPVLALCFFLILFFGFRTPLAFKGRLRLWVYYLVQTVSLAVAALFTVFGMRGGMTMATRPITLSNANQYVDRPVDASLVLNTPFSIFRTLGKKPFVVPQYMSAEEMERVYTPVHLPTPGARFQSRNVVIFILEGFCKQFSGLSNPMLGGAPYEGATPFLDSLMLEGVSYRYSYANGRKSIDGMPSVLSGIPSFVEPFFLTPAALNDVSGVVGELARHKGYASGFFHGAMNGSMGFQAFANATGFERYFGRTEYNADPNYGGDADFDGTWAIWDEEFLQFFCDRLGEMRTPFAASVFTATSHAPFVVPERYKGVFPDGNTPLHPCVAYTDMALRRFFEKARTQPWFENTLFVLTADHTNGISYPEYRSDIGDYSVPIVFYAPGMEEVRGGVDAVKIANQMDIMPTVLGLLGYDRPYVAFGQDLFQTPAEETLGVQYLPSSGVYQYEQGDYLIHFDGERVQKAYRFREDPTLSRDILDEMPGEVRQDMENRLRAIIQQYMQRMNNNELVYRE